MSNKLMTHRSIYDQESGREDRQIGDLRDVRERNCGMEDSGYARGGVARVRSVDNFAAGK